MRRHYKIIIKSKIFFISFSILLILTAFLLGRNSATKVIENKNSNDSPPKVSNHIAVNKQFKFPLKDDKGMYIADIIYTVTSADIQDEIIINGQRAKAIKGRTFLIINIKIENTTNKSVEINSRDYMRLTINNSKELLASDIHNDPVQVQAISTKYTRLGFPINSTDKKLFLHIGEIDGTKTILPLKIVTK